jgi:hypothetical protein
LVFATLVFAYFAFVTLSFHILLLPCQFMVIHQFSPKWGKNKMSNLEWQKKGKKTVWRKQRFPKLFSLCEQYKVMYNLEVGFKEFSAGFVKCFHFVVIVHCHILIQTNSKLTVTM